MSISWYIVGDDRAVFHTGHQYWALSSKGSYPRASFSFASKSKATARLKALVREMPGIRGTVMDRASLFETLGLTDPQPDFITFHDRERVTPLKLHRQAQAARKLLFQCSCLRPLAGITPVIV